MECTKADLEMLENEYSELLNDSGYIKDKKQALNVCNILTKSNLVVGGVKEGSIIHLLGLRLYDYISREIK